MTYKRVIMYALLAELGLILIQFGYLEVYANFMNPSADLAFDTDYMKHVGFYIFQVIGFFIVTAVAFLVLKKSQKSVVNKLLTLFIIGGTAELLFYLLIEASFEIGFLFSILDKFIAIASGVIIYYVISPGKRTTEITQ